MTRVPFAFTGGKLLLSLPTGGALSLHVLLIHLFLLLMAFLLLRALQAGSFEAVD